MPVKHIVSPGVGFSPSTVKWIVTRGLGASPVAYVQPSVAVALTLRPRSTTLNAPSWNQVCTQSGWHYVRERWQHVTPDEGITWTIATNWADNPTAATFTVTDEGGAIVSTWYSSSTVTLATKNVILPKATIPSALGRYYVKVSIEAGGRSPIIIIIPVEVGAMPYTHQTEWQTIRKGEGIAFAIVTTPWGGTPTSITDTAYNAITNQLAPTMNPNGSTSADGDNAVLRELIAPSGLSTGLYYVKVSFASGGFDPAIAYLMLRAIE